MNCIVSNDLYLNVHLEDNRDRTSSDITYVSRTFGTIIMSFDDILIGHIRKKTCLNCMP